MKYLFLLLFSASLLAQDLPEAPHKFWDSRQKITFALTSGIRAADIAVTCRAISNRGSEHWLPVKSCGGVAAWIAAGQFGQVSFQYWLHKTNHHRLERIAPWISVAPNSLGIGWTLTHKDPWTPRVGDTLRGGGCTGTWNGSRWITACP
jgi:hypothetical protein